MRNSVGFNRHNINNIMTSPASGGAKENSGESAKRRRQRKIFLATIGCLSTYVILATIYQSHFAGMFVPDVEYDPVTGRQRIRRRPNRMHGLFAKDDGSKNNELATNIDAILEGYLTLVDLNIPSDGLQGPSDQGYHDITANFCSIDWKLQQSNPSTVPMFKDLRWQSPMCESTMVTVDVASIIQKVKEFDKKAILGGSKTNEKIHVVEEPNGVVFHETRCGSTLAANLMASITSPDTPSTHHSTTTSRVYSESPPPATLLKACDRNPCNPQLHAKLIRDVIYLMGRSSKPLDYLFFKIQSIGSINIDKFTAAFPNVPWVFVFRDSVEIMQSHLGKEGKPISASTPPVCARNYRAKNQSIMTQQILSKHSINQPSDISITQYCAVHLGALSLSAIQEHQRSGKGRFVNYNQLPDIMWTNVIPNDFGIQLNEKQISNMKSVSGVYSKGRGDKANADWKDDSDNKQNTASKAVVDATHMFLDDIYNQMEEYSTSISSSTNNK